MSTPEQDRGRAGGWTPGPWEAFTPPASDVISVMLDRRVGGRGQPEVVHWTGFDASHVEDLLERRANARLIAAAPDMYDVLAEWVRLHDGGGMGIESATAHLDRLLRAARAALLKATGGQQGAGHQERGGEG